MRGGIARIAIARRAPVLAEQAFRLPNPDRTTA